MKATLVITVVLGLFHISTSINFANLDFLEDAVSKNLADQFMQLPQPFKNQIGALLLSGHIQTALGTLLMGSSLADKGILNENLLSKILDSVPFASVLKSPLDLLHDIQIENVVGDSPIGSLLGGDLLKGLPTGDISGNLVGNSPVKGLLGGDPLKGLPTSRITGNLVGNSRVSGRLGGNLFQSLPTGDLTGNLVGNSPVGSLLEGNPLKGDLLDSLPTGDLVGNSPVKAATSVLGGSSDVLGENNLLGGLLGKREHTKRKLKEGDGLKKRNVLREIMSQ